MRANNPRLLVVDDDISVLEQLSYVLSSLGEVETAEDGTEARAKFRKSEYDIVLLDYLLPDTDGLKLLQEFKDYQPRTEIILITHVQEIKTAVKAIKIGAFDFINKDFDIESLKAVIFRAVEKLKYNRELLYLRSEVQRLHEQNFIFGQSQVMLSIRKTMDRAAETSVTILLQGESGTGKELAARYIHNHSPRADKPFVAVNMASIPSNLLESILFGHEKGSFTGALKTTYGKFELAEEGTIFLDEISDLRLDLQAKLLRVMQESEIERVGKAKAIPVDVRVIAATHRDLKRLVGEGEFREDLYYRLNVVPFTLPSLMERAEDIPLFVDFFLKRYNRKYRRNLKFSPEALRVLPNYDWPGNIRELENLIARLVAIHNSDIILPEDIPIDYSLSSSAISKDKEKKLHDRLKAATEAFERGFILRTLEKENWHQENSAARLGVHRKTLEYKLRKLNLLDIVEQGRKNSKPAQG